MSGAMAALAGLQLAGSFYSAYQQRKAAKEEAEMMRYKASLRRAQAVEYRKKAGVNRTVRLRQLQVLQGQQQGAFAKGGVDITSGTPLLVLDNSARMAAEEIMHANNDVMYKAQQIEIGADILDSEAGGVEKAGKIDFFSTLLGGTIGAASTASKGNYGDGYSDSDLAPGVADDR